MTSDPSTTMPVRTSDGVRERIISLKGSGLSFRQISTLPEFTTQEGKHVPAGTICAIYNGAPVPFKWYDHFQLEKTAPARVCPVHHVVHLYDCKAQVVKPLRATPPRRYRDLYDTPLKELRRQLENREVVA